MPTLRQFTVDAFSKVPFAGNPAAVMPLAEWLPDELMQSIAMENNQAETAFFVPEPEGGDADFHLRWFTPAVEVDLCGHATVASAHVLYTELGFDKPEVVFRSRSGLLRASRLVDGKVQLDFPETPLTRDESSELLAQVTEALGAQPTEIYQSMDLICVFETQAQIESMSPNFAIVAQVKGVRAVAVTAPGSGEYNFVARMFAPQCGINEDPVTGSLYTMLTPYWAKRLGKNEMTAYQLSNRGGEVSVRLDPDNAPGRVFIAGHAVTTVRSEFILPG